MATTDGITARWDRFSNEILRGVAGFRGNRRVLRAGPGIAHAMDYRNRGQHCDHPKHRRHAVEQCSDDHEHEAFRAFHEAYAAGSDQRFGAGAGVTDHDGAYHNEGSEHDIKETVAAGVIDEHAQEPTSITVAVDHRIAKYS